MPMKYTYEIYICTVISTTIKSTIVLFFVQVLQELNPFYVFEKPDSSLNLSQVCIGKGPRSHAAEQVG